jgi:hypothetical protein
MGPTHGSSTSNAIVLIVMFGVAPSLDCCVSRMLFGLLFLLDVNGNWDYHTLVL